MINNIISVHCTVITEIMLAKINLFIGLSLCLGEMKIISFSEINDCACTMSSGKSTKKCAIFNTRGVIRRGNI